MTPEPSWTRPADWLPLPAADNSFVGLVAVWENGFNSVALQCAGNYTVDWGDGTSDLIQSNTTAQHEYTYSGLTGTDCTRGYRQAVVVVTPQSGQVLSKVDLDQRHTSATTAVGASPWLDVAVSSASLTSLIFGSAVRFARNLEQATIGLHAVTDMSELFAGCYALQSVPLFDTSSVTTMQHMFDVCEALQSIPLFDTSSVTEMSSMFSGCDSLASGAMSGTKVDVSYESCNLSATELDRIYTNLGTVTGKTITVSGNPGTTGDTPSIASTKGWTVTGS